MASTPIPTSSGGNITPRQRSQRRCRGAKAILAYLLLQLACLSVSFFVRNAIDLSGFAAGNDSLGESGLVSLKLQDGKVVSISFDGDDAKVIDCHLLSRKGRLETSSFINERWKRDGKHGRSAQSIEGEIALHALCYLLGINKSSSKDADLSVYGDERWYVYELSGLMEFIGC